MLIEYRDTANWQTISGENIIWSSNEQLFLNCEPVFMDTVSSDFQTSFGGRDYLVKRNKWDVYDFEFFVKENYHKEISYLPFCKSVKITTDTGKIYNLDTELPEYLTINAEPVSNNFAYKRIRLTFRDYDTKTEINYLSNASTRYGVNERLHCYINLPVTDLNFYSFVPAYVETETINMQSEQNGINRIFRNMVRSYASCIFALTESEVKSLEEGLAIGTITFTLPDASTYTSLEPATISKDVLDKNTILVTIRILYNKVITYPYA